MRVTRNVAAIAVIAMAGLGAALYSVASPSLYQAGQPAEVGGHAAEAPAAGDPSAADSVVLRQSQVQEFVVEAAGSHVFPVEKEAVGSIDFNEDMAVQIFPPYAGRIVEAFAKVGDDVKKGQVLFTIESPDLISAENTLITAAGVLDLKSVVLKRVRAAFEAGGNSRNDVDQAVSDQMGAEGALKAARDAVHIFGKTSADIDRMVRERKTDPILVVPSPISGHVTARNAAPGLFVQPGTVPAPYTVADLSTKWLVANVVESDTPLFCLGQEVRVKVTAYPDRVFQGKISTLGSAIDPTTHRLLVRSEISDPRRELRPGMLATFMIQAGDPVAAIAVPADAVVHEGDGTDTIWTTVDRRLFKRRVVKIGRRDSGYVQITEGVQPGELVVTKNAIFLSNMLIDSAS